MATTEAAFVPLESGDRLSRAGFHRRYCARPDIKKAELVRGVVDVPSPVRHGPHSHQSALVVLWLGAHAAQRRTSTLLLCRPATGDVSPAPENAGTTSSV